MYTYLILLRGINVGGKNKIPMSELKAFLEEQGYERVVTYIQSGNVVLQSKIGAEALSTEIEDVLPKKFKLDSSIVRIAAFEYKVFKKIVLQAPKEFGKDNATYRYNVIFLMGISPSKAMEQIDPRQDVDDVWQGDEAIYHRNSIQNASKSHLSKLSQKPMYKSITIRNWNTTTKLLELLEEHKN